MFGGYTLPSVLELVLRLGYRCALRLFALTRRSHLSIEASTPGLVSESPLIQDCCKRYDDETSCWARNILEKGLFTSPYCAQDPEGIHDGLRLRGILPLLGDLYVQTGSPIIRDRMLKLLQHTADLCDTRSVAGWDPTTSALRMISCLRTFEILRLSNVVLLGKNSWFQNFVEKHRMILEIGRYVEPAGNHRALNVAGRAAVSLLLREDEPLNEDLLREFQVIFQHQFLSDGGHIERTPHYHLQILELLNFFGHADSARGGALQSRVKEIACTAATALGGMLAPDGTPIRFGDVGRSFSGRHSNVKAFDVTGNSLKIPKRNQMLLRDFGLATWSWQHKQVTVQLAVDFGPLGLPTNPGHGHADALSYCFYVSGRDIVADPGTYLYSDSAEACWFKLPQAHNSVYCPRHPTCNLTRYFRWKQVAHPPTRINSSHDHILLDAFQKWRVGNSFHRHRRSWFRIKNGFAVLDKFLSASDEIATSRIGLHPESHLRNTEPEQMIVEWPDGRIRISVQGTVSNPCRIGRNYYAPRYGLRCPATALEWHLERSSRVRELCTRFELEL